MRSKLENRKEKVINSQTDHIEAYIEIIELFPNGSYPQKIVSFKPFQASKQRVQELLEKNKSGSLTSDEDAELDDFGQIEHLMRFVKARSHQNLQLKMD